ncbi:MAG: HEPN domain-containing protein [Candidatus Latescibacterota bacterium]
MAATATIDHARKIASDIVRELAPLSVVLFGSVAKNEVGNDVDILIITEGEPGDDTRAVANRVLKPYHEDCGIDYFMASAHKVMESLRSGDPFLNLILQEGKTLYMKNFVEKWVQDAKEDYAAAVTLLQTGYHKTACFHAHQSVEKHIKAQLLQEGWSLEKTHSIRRLMNYARQYGLSFQIGDEDLSFMDSIYAGRYPAGSGLLPYGDPTREDAERAVTIASGVTGYGP